MKYNVIAIAVFERAFKRLSKKYASLKDDVANLIAQLEENPYIGADLGHNIRKIRLAIASKGKGKSGGARVITKNIVVNVENTQVFLVTIYDKSEQEVMTVKEVEEIISNNILTISNS